MDTGGVESFHAICDPKVKDAAFAILEECERLRHLLGVIDASGQQEGQSGAPENLLHIEPFLQLADGILKRIDGHASTVSGDVSPI